MATNKDIVLVDSKQESRLAKQTIFDISEQEFARLQFLADSYAASSFNPKKDNKPQRTNADYILIMLKGMELGFSPMASVDNISIINGKPTVDGKGMLAVAYASGAMEDIKIVGDEKACTVTIKRKGVASIFSFTFTIDDAKAMELLSKQGSQYLKQPKVMLKWRAVANCLREALPDFMGGLYTQEEIAPHDVTVSDSGDMEYKAPQLTAPQSANEFLGNTPKDEWLEMVKAGADWFYSHPTHRDNSIEKKLNEGYISRNESTTVTVARLLMYRAMKDVSDKGLGLTEEQISDAFGNISLGNFMKQDGATWGTTWATLVDYAKKLATDTHEEPSDHTELLDNDRHWHSSNPMPTDEIPF